jgi:predicted acylesterase/phospholipase RssA
VSGVSIGAINAACVVGARDRADARARLASLWSALSLEASKYVWDGVGRNLALFGVPGFYEPRPDIWNLLHWTSWYDSRPMLQTLREHVDFEALNNSTTAFVVTAVDVATGELIRFRNHDGKDGPRTFIEPEHVMASGSLPPPLPATKIHGTTYWDGGIIDNTPLGDVIDAFSGADGRERILIVMNLFRMQRALPTNMLEVNDRLSELRFGNRVRQDSMNAHTMNELLQTIEELAAVVPAEALDEQLEARIAGARRFKVLDAITNIDLADPYLMAAAGFPPVSSDPNAFRDFSAAGITRRRDAGYRIAQSKLRELFDARGLLTTPQ